MTNVLHHIRKQSIEKRKRYMYGVVALCACVVVLLWIIGLGYRLADVSIQGTIDRQKDVLNVLSATQTSFEPSAIQIVEPKTDTADRETSEPFIATEDSEVDYTQ